MAAAALLVETDWHVERQVLGEAGGGTRGGTRRIGRNTLVAGVVVDGETTGLWPAFLLHVAARSDGERPGRLGVAGIALAVDDTGDVVFQAQARRDLDAACRFTHLEVLQRLQAQSVAVGKTDIGAAVATTIERADRIAGEEAHVNAGRFVVVAVASRRQRAGEGGGVAVEDLAAGAGPGEPERRAVGQPAGAAADPCSGTVMPGVGLEAGAAAQHRPGIAAVAFGEDRQQGMPGLMACRPADAGQARQDLGRCHLGLWCHLGQIGEPGRLRLAGLPMTAPVRGIDCQAPRIEIRRTGAGQGQVAVDAAARRAAVLVFAARCRLAGASVRRFMVAAVGEVGIDEQFPEAAQGYALGQPAADGCQRPPVQAVGAPPGHLGLAGQRRSGETGHEKGYSTRTEVHAASLRS